MVVTWSISKNDETENANNFFVFNYFVLVPWWLDGWLLETKSNASNLFIVP